VFPSSLSGKVVDLIDKVWNILNDGAH
jgi:hypothetical protein